MIRTVSKMRATLGQEIKDWTMSGDNQIKSPIKTVNPRGMIQARGVGEWN
jgi:hypothetical protein